MASFICQVFGKGGESGEGGEGGEGGQVANWEGDGEDDDEEEEDSADGSEGDDEDDGPLIPDAVWGALARLSRDISQLALKLHTSSRVP